MNETDVRAAAKKAVAAYPNRKAAASAIGIGPAYLGEILNGSRPPGRELLHFLGLRREIVYRRIVKGA